MMNYQSHPNINIMCTIWGDFLERPSLNYMHQSALGVGALTDFESPGVGVGGETIL